MGVLEEGGKAVGGVVSAMSSQPMALALVVLNLGLLTYLYYYTSRITSRTEQTAQALFNANDKLYEQWGTIVKDTNTLTEKTIHCILPEDAIKLLQGGGGRFIPERPDRPEPPEPLKPNKLQLPPINPRAEKSLLFLPLTPLQAEQPEQ
jgi:hypothetical protein